MKVEYSKHASKVLDSLDTKTTKRIVDAVHTIPNGDIKPMQGCRGLYRLRVGGWRILFSRINDLVFVSKISPRGDAYKKGGM